MGSSTIQQQINELGHLFGKMGTNPELEELDNERLVRVGELREAIIDHLLWFPGEMITSKNAKQTEWLKLVIDFVWRGLEKEEIEDELMSGGYTGLLSNHVTEFSKRVRMLKPTFTSLKTANKEFEIYFREAMKAWLYGIDHAAVILSFSLLENLIKEKVIQVEPEALVKLDSQKNPKKAKPASIGSIIKKAYQKNIITYTQKEFLFELKDKRNNMVHDFEEIATDESYEIIQRTKEFTEDLLNIKEES